MKSTNVTVGSLLGKSPDSRSFVQDDSWVCPSLLVGIEIELEKWVKTPYKNNVSKWWVRETDDSLREVDGFPAYEIKLRLPLSGKDLTAALNGLRKELSKVVPLPINTERTSTHIHIDARSWAPYQLTKFLVLATTYEKPLLNYCEPFRRNNNFCLPYHVAEGVVFENLSPFFVQNASKTSMLDPKYRYSAWSLASLSKFGSIENRMLEGVTDIDRLTEWINILMCLVKEAEESKVALHKWPAEYSMRGPTEEAKRIFGKYYPKLHYDNISHDLLLGIRQAQDIIYRNREITAFTDVVRGTTSEVVKQFAKKHQLKPLLHAINPPKGKSKDVSAYDLAYTDLIASAFAGAAVQPDMPVEVIIPPEPEDDDLEDYDDDGNLVNP